MQKSRAYRAVRVKQVVLDRVLSGREASAAVSVGLDVGKEAMFVTLRWGPNDFERPWLVENPFEINELMSRLRPLNEGRKMTVALEPTGTYGDAFRQAMSDAKFPLQRVSPKASHDYAEVFDGVPSKHDGKDAAVVAELAAMGKSSQWPFALSEWEQRLSFQVDWQEAQRRQLTVWCGRLEGLLARHWPEASRDFKVSSGVLLRCLSQYGGPAGLAADAAGAQQLLTWSRGRLSAARRERLLSSAGESVGVRQTPADVERMQAYAQEALLCRRKMRESRRTLADMAADHAVLSRMAKAVGAVTACVLWSDLGDPRDYECGPAYRKAMGLNLKERSSGKWVGRVKISKRGPSRVRRWLYFGALRLIRVGGVQGWYARKKSRGGDAAAMRGVVGVMRKLSLALYRVSFGEEEFDAEALFPAGRRRSSGEVQSEVSQGEVSQGEDSRSEDSRSEERRAESSAEGAGAADRCEQAREKGAAPEGTSRRRRSSRRPSRRKKSRRKKSSKL